MMNELNEKQQAKFTEEYYYSCLYNALVLFAATPHYLKKLDGPLFDVPFEMESELDYAFNEPVFSSVFKSGRVAEALRSELTTFKDEINSLSNELWQWEEILSNSAWQTIRTCAEELLCKIGENRREYDFSFTNIIEA